MTGLLEANSWESMLLMRSERSRQWLWIMFWYLPLVLVRVAKSFEDIFRMRELTWTSSMEFLELLMSFL